MPVKSPIMNKQLHKGAFIKQDLNRDCWNYSKICATTSNCSESRCASRKILPAAEGNFLVSLPWQVTVAWENGAKLSLLALQQVIHQQLSHPCPRLAHPKPREGWTAGERKHNKPSSTNSCHLGMTAHRPAALFAKYCLQFLLRSP